MQPHVQATYHGDVGNKLLAFEDGPEIGALRDTISAAMKSLRTRPMLPRDYAVLQRTLEQLRLADPCTILRDVSVTGETVRDLNLASTSIVVANTSAYADIHCFNGSTFQLARDSFNAVSVLFPLVIDGPRTGQYQIRRDASIFNYGEHTMRLLGMSVLMAHAFERVARNDEECARLIMPINEGAFYKGWLIPNDINPDSVGVWRRHEFNRKSASNKDKRTPYSAGDGFMKFQSYVEKAHGADQCGEEEQDVFHALNGLFSRTMEDGLLRKICLNHINADLYPLSSEEERRKENIINGLAEMYTDRREFMFLARRYAFDDSDTPRLIR